jgi:hypothetical protein
MLKTVLALLTRAREGQREAKQASTRMTVPRQHAPGPPPGVAVSEPQVSSPLEASPGGEVWRRLRARQAEGAGGGARQSQNGRPTPAAGVYPSSRISRRRRWMDQSEQGDGFTVSSLYQIGRSRRRREGEMVEVEIAGGAEPLLLWRRAAAQQGTPGSRDGAAAAVAPSCSDVWSELASRSLGERYMGV